MKAPYTIRFRERFEASPRAGQRQQWDEWQVVVGRKVVSRHDTREAATRAAQALDTKPPTGGQTS